MGRRRARSPAILRRGKAQKSLGHLHWIFCEGKTEKRCLEELARFWRLASVRVDPRLGHAPSAIVKMAKEKKKELKKESGAWTIHVVFDRDEHPGFREALEQARANGFCVGYSNPCVELWAILLHQDQTAWIERKEAQSKLKQIHPGYCHKSRPILDLKTVINGLEDASQRSKNLLRRAREAGNPFGNPTTEFFRVIAAINRDR